MTDIGREFFRSTGFFKAQLQIIATESYFFENIRHSVVRICSEFLLALIPGQGIIRLIDLCRKKGCCMVQLISCVFSFSFLLCTLPLR